MMVLRNSIYNIIGLGLPAIVAVGTIPVLLAILGTERFGILTIIWAVVSYFGLFDLGLGRAVTHQFASAVAAGQRDRLNPILGTATVLMLAFALLGGLIMLTVTPWLARQLASGSDVRTVEMAFFWMALAMPAIVLTSGYRGILEATGRFDLVNAIRLPMGIFTFVGPLITVYAVGPRLDLVSAVLCVGRFAACAVHAWFALRQVQERTGFGSIDRSYVRPLLTTGGWLTVSNIVSPLMNYVDRFLLGIAMSASAVAFYVTPQELILRIGIVPGAIAAVLFPLFSSTSVIIDNARDSTNVRRYSLLIFSLMFPITLILVIFPDLILTWWISKDFADQAANILQIMAIAALASGVAQVPYTMLQGSGRADVTAKLHLLELPIYVVLLYFLISNYGPIGAAWAWLIRITADMLLLYALNTWIGRIDTRNSTSIQSTCL